MPNEWTRRAVVAGVLGLTAGGAAFSDASSYLDRLAPLSGSAWDAARRDLPSEVDSPHGRADVRFDDWGVPHVDADTETALYYAAGYVQAADRIFQMDLQRRQMRGTLSAVAGESTVDSDVFHRKMDFAGAADATWDLLADTETGALVEAYAEGVNRYVERGTLPLEFELLEFAPDPWTPADTVLLEKQISWNLTGSFHTLRDEVRRDAFDEATFESLFPRLLDHDAPIVRDGAGGGATNGDGAASADDPAPSFDAGGRAELGNRETDRELVDWLSAFESGPGVGSNSWVASGEHTASGRPVVANDPHLLLMAPPVWYEMALRTDEFRVRGVTFPGVPFVVIGENHAGAWGFTNAGADVIDFYEYERDGNRYRYRDEWREFETRTETVAVAGGDDREVTVRKTVHGPVVDREGREVAVAWTGLTATETSVAVREFARSDGLDEMLAAVRRFDEPTQNLVYADRDGRTLYYTTGRIPVRRTDGRPVRGTRVFDGSAGEGEWAGFEPYGESTWEGFVPFDEKPHVVDPGYLATANQRIADDPAHYLSEGYSSPFRGRCIYDRLDAAVEGGESVGHEFARDLQRDTYDTRADHLVPVVLDAVDRMDGRAREEADRLRDWDRRMDRDSRGALTFDRFWRRYRERLFRDPFAARGLDESYWPNAWVTATLAADDPWFDELGADRAAVVADAMADAAAEIDREGWEAYGDLNVADVDHQFPLDFLDYPERPTDGSPYTVFNYRRPTDPGDDAVGSSWRMVSEPGGPSFGVLPGGNDGDYFSEHYADQFGAWADGEYRELTAAPDGDPDVRFEGEDDG